MHVYYTILRVITNPNPVWMLIKKNTQLCYKPTILDPPLLGLVGRFSPYLHAKRAVKFKNYAHSCMNHCPCWYAVVAVVALLAVITVD